jgi:hypothetical protein
MKCASSASKRMPPAVEIAEATGCTPVRCTGTALINAASSSARNDDSGRPRAVVASCSSAVPTGGSLTALRSTFDSDCLPRGAASLPASAAVSMSGLRSMVSVAPPSRAIASRNGADSA